MSAPPEWFRRALAHEADTGATTVEGTRIAYRRWGDPAAPGVVLVHGGAAHARWWDHLAPFLTPHYHVVAPDLSGHGDSGRREGYHPELWADELAAVADHAGIQGRPVLVGHSMGGFVSIVAAARFGADLAGAVIVDSPVRRPDPEIQESRGGRMFRAPKTYPTLDEAVTHFHLVPPQPVVTPYVVDHVARHSLHEVEGGWTWKFDAHVFGGFSPFMFGGYLSRAACRMAVFYGELSPIVDRDITDHMSELLGRNAPFVEIPQAYHHLILDQPIAFVAALRAMLADWQHTVPAHQLPRHA